MAGISSVGVGSGLDLEGLITNLISAESLPKLNSLAVREATIQANISAFGNLKSVLDQFKSSLGGLSDPEVLQARTAGTSDPQYFTASADSEAVAGQYSIQVLNLAQAHKLVTTADFADAAATVGEGTLDITAGSSSFQVNTSAGTTLGELKDLINDAGGNNGVSASFLVVAKDPLDAGAGTVTRLVLTATDTGAYNGIEVAVTDIDTNNTDNLGLSRFYFSSADIAGSQLDEQQAGEDARIAVDGFTAFSSSNSFSGVIDGVSITAHSEPEDPLAPKTETLTVALSRASVAAQIQQFVESYNEVVGTIRQVSAYDAATETAGPLNGDSTVRGIASRLRSLTTGAVAESSGIQTLVELGIETQRNGKLLVNTSTLKEALDSHFEEISTLFASENGIATRLDNALENYLGRDGILNTRTQGFDRQLQSIDDQRDALATRLEKLEKTYRDRFTALDALVARLQSSGDFLLAQLETTSKIIGRTPGGGDS